MAAYFLTFRCYGTWLHGDERGSVDDDNNVYGTPRLGTHHGLKRAELRQMKHAPILLDATRRQVVDKAVREVANHRGWEIFALAVRSNHVHIVVGANQEPNRVMTDFKSWSTRRLREIGLLTVAVRPWARHGSTRYLWDENAIGRACAYVGEGQDYDFEIK